MAICVICYLMLELCDALRHAPSASMADNAHVPGCCTLYQLPMAWAVSRARVGKKAVVSMFDDLGLGSKSKLVGL
jgi:hypothetical protein